MTMFKDRSNDDLARLAALERLYAKVDAALARAIELTGTLSGTDDPDAVAELANAADNAMTEAGETLEAIRKLKAKMG